LEWIAAEIGNLQILTFLNILGNVTQIYRQCDKANYSQTSYSY